MFLDIFLCFPIPHHAKRKPTWRSKMRWLAKLAWYDVTWKPSIEYADFTELTPAPEFSENNKSRTLTNADNEAYQLSHLYDQLIKKITLSGSANCKFKRWSHSAKTKISCQSSLQFLKHPDRMWNDTTQNSIVSGFSQRTLYLFLLKSWWTSSMIEAYF